MINFLVSFIGVLIMVLGIMGYVSGLVRASITKKSFSDKDALFAAIYVSLGVAILLAI